ncbi:CxxH/CxxC protein [Sedimentibacter sp. zth1]|uniref:CxxH/CxxC protein n=1 Tax=Sedimentibacter sp. zth1 TaxID=2816908 RepID=UPI001A9173E3|nr:CxxH/CxxC protein [Sedimentibacter sp. zth1]QSX05011.1 CxxH/CxxC protein [Sedimentibacter sp. zth1]
MDDKVLIFACKEHVEMVIDDYVNEFEVAPKIEVCTDKVCKYCSNQSEYVIFE